MKKLLKSKVFIVMLVMSFMLTYIMPRTINVSANGLNALPEGFRSTLIGTGNECSVTYNEEEESFTVNGAGKAIGKDKGTVDNYQLVSYGIEGDGTIIARLVDFDMSGAQYGQAGIIMRSDDSTDNADYLAVYIEPSKNEYRYAFRDNVTGGTGAQRLSGLTSENNELYIKITKKDTSFKYYVAEDLEFNNVVASGGQIIKSESTSWNLGFVVSNGGSSTSAVAKFDNVTVLNGDQVLYPAAEEETPEVPETPEGAETPELPEVPETPEVPEMPEEPGIEDAFLPRGFSNVNVGNDEETAYAHFNTATSMFTIKGSGKQIGKDPNVADSYQLVSYEVEGDATVIARLVDFDMSKAANGQTGIIIRNDNTASAADYFAVYVEPGKNQYRYAYRDNAAGKSGAAVINGLTASDKGLYIKIVKDGNVFRYYISEDASFPANKTYSNSQTVKNNSSTWNVGFVASNGGSKESITAKYDNVRIETAKKVYFDSSLEVMPVDTVENLSAAAGNAKVELTWNAVETAEKYIVKRSLSKDGNYEIIAETTEINYLDTDVENFTTYYYKVAAANEEGCGYDSLSVKALPSFTNPENIQYEDNAAVFAMTEEPNDTVFSSVITLAGATDKNGTITVKQDGNVVAGPVEKAASEEFKFNLTLNLGRNEIEVIQTTENNEKTIKNYNVVYLNGLYYDIIVDGNFDGNGNVDVSRKKIFSSVEDAIKTVSTKNNERVVIFIKNGTYKEKLVIESPYITLIGEDSEGTVLTYDDANGTINPATGMKYGTSKSASIYVKTKAKGFMAENLTIENSFVEKGEEGEQAVAFTNQADESILVNCRFIGNQDTLLADAGSSSPARQYYYQCYIEGDVDFIFGRAQAVFDDCDIVSVNRGSNTNNGYITAADTWDKDSYGYVIMNSRLIGLDGIADETVSIGRPWRPSSAAEKVTPSVVYVNCYMGSHIKTNGWDDMGDSSLALDSRFYEFGSFGPGAKASDARNTLNASEAAEYSLEKVFAADSAGTNYAAAWNPKSTDNSSSINTIFKDIVKATSIELDLKEIEIEEGQTVKVNAVVMPAEASNNDVLFESSNSEIVTVSQEGVVTAIKNGTAVITARTGNVYSVIEVSVQEAANEEESPVEPPKDDVNDDLEQNKPVETPDDSTDKDESEDTYDSIDKDESADREDSTDKDESADIEDSNDKDDTSDDILEDEEIVKPSTDKEDNSADKNQSSDEIVVDKNENNGTSDKKDDLPITGGTSALVVLSIAVLLILSGLVISRKKEINS